MTQHEGAWPAGTPCWVDIMAGDLDRTQAFYSEVVGWDYTESDPAYGGYCNAQRDGKMVAGLSPTMEGMEQAPHVWTVYLATDDIEATDAAATKAGAQRVVAPMEIPPSGWMGMWTDPTGVVFGAWQSGEHTGFEVVQEHGSVTWIDLATPDPDQAREFYSALYGYSYQDIGQVGMSYALFTVPGGDQPSGGIGAPPPDAEGMPPAWGVCFEVDDVDAAAKRVSTAGGTVLREPYDFEYGRLCMAGGPDGEPFALITSKAAMEPQSE